MVIGLVEQLVTVRKWKKQIEGEWRMVPTSSNSPDLTLPITYMYILHYKRKVKVGTTNLTHRFVFRSCSKFGKDFYTLFFI